jgi:crotonobetainyl-CoA:carnitine CoA-transferase CaiB-like acyl-CoA transferase
MAGPCSGLTVLDFSFGMPGALATAVFADFGAEVIKVEPPTGDPFRSNPSWLAWNRGKKSIVLDLETPKGQEDALALARRADILVESFRPGESQRLGIDYESLSQISPRLVYCSVTGFGQKGRLRNLKDYEGIIAAKCGRMSTWGGQLDRQGPVYAAVQTATWAASQGAVRGILGALRIRDRLGRGQWVQTSVLQGMIPYYGGRQITTFFSRKDPDKFPPVAQNAQTLPNLGYIPVRTKDGRWLQHANIQFSPRLLHAHLRAIGLGWVLEDERFKNTSSLTAENQEILRELILEKMQEKTVDEWMDIYVKDGDIAAEPFLHTVEAMKHEQFVHNRHVLEINDPRVGPMKIVGLLADLADTPGEVGGPAPNLGQDTHEVLNRMVEQEPLPVGNGSNDHGLLHPLGDITVLDLSTVIAGPYGAVMIADMGARVIKIDATPGRGMPGVGAVNLNNIRTYSGKECIRADLQTEEGRDLIHKLIAKADVLLHNFRPGVPDRLGIDYETCRKINPRLVHVYVGAYGATGPQSRRPGAHPLPGALFGGALRQAGRAMPPPAYQPMDMSEIKDTSRRMMRANEGNPDPNSSQSVGTAIMLGLWDRERTGRGQAIQVTMMCANAWANHDEAYDYAGRPPYAIPDAECYGLHALYRLYEAKEGWVFLACLFEEEWAKFCQTVGKTDLMGDPRFASAARLSHDEELISQLSVLFASRTATEWEDLLTGEDVACVRVADDSEEFFLDDSHSKDNDLAVDVEDESPRFGKYVRNGGIVHFAGMAGRYMTAPYPGQHTRAIMGEVGYSDEQIDDYRERHIVDWEEVNPIFAS